MCQATIDTSIVRLIATLCDTGPRLNWKPDKIEFIDFIDSLLGYDSNKQSNMFKVEFDHVQKQFNDTVNSG